MDYLKLIKKPSDLKYYLVDKYPDNKFFSSENMRFTGDTMSNYGLQLVETLEGNKLFELLQQLPPQTVDLVISSGENSKVANYILDYPMVQNKGHAQFLSWVEFVFDKKYNAIDDARTKIFQPIELCHSFLKNSFDCYTKEKLDNEELIPAMFLGKKISIEPLPKFTSDK